MRTILAPATKLIFAGAMITTGGASIAQADTYSMYGPQYAPPVAQNSGDYYSAAAGATTGTPTATPTPTPPRPATATPTSTPTPATDPMFTGSAPAPAAAAATTYPQYSSYPTTTTEASPVAVPSGAPTDAGTTMVIATGEDSTFVSSVAPPAEPVDIWDKIPGDEDTELTSYVQHLNAIKAANRGGAGAVLAFTTSVKDLLKSTEANWREKVEISPERAEDVAATLITGLTVLRGLTPEARIDALLTIEAIIKPCDRRLRKTIMEKLFQHMLAVELFQPEPVKVFCAIYPTEGSLPEIEGLTGPAKEIIPHALTQGYIRTRAKERDEHWRLYRYIESIRQDHTAVRPFYQLVANEIAHSQNDSLNWINAVSEGLMNRKTELALTSYKHLLRDSGVVSALALRSAKSGDDADFAVSVFEKMPEEGLANWHLIMSGFVNNSKQNAAVDHAKVLILLAGRNVDEKQRMKDTSLEWLRQAKPESATAEALQQLYSILVGLP